MEKIRLKVYRGDSVKGELKEYQLEIDEGMVVLDAIHKIQATQAPDLACRWNCKAGRCGSCSAEVNGFPRLMCMTQILLRTACIPTERRLTTPSGRCGRPSSAT